MYRKKPIAAPLKKIYKPTNRARPSNHPTNKTRPSKHQPSNWTRPSNQPSNWTRASSKQTNWARANDIDCFKTQNCHPVKRKNDQGEVLICFYASRNIEKDEELRYAYNSSYAPWRKPAFHQKYSGSTNQTVKWNKNDRAKGDGNEKTDCYEVEKEKLCCEEKNNSSLNMADLQQREEFDPTKNDGNKKHDCCEVEKEKLCCEENNVT